jgi:glycosyl transferase family 25
MNKSIIIASIVVCNFWAYDTSHAATLDEAQFKNIASMQATIDACYSLDANHDGTISDIELNPASDYLQSWGAALEVRQACKALMGDPYLSTTRASEKDSFQTHAELGFYVINLKKSDKRLAKMVQTFEAANLNFSRIDAVNGRDLNLLQLRNEGFYKPAPEESRWLNPGEVGAYLSHRKAWKQILKDGVSYGIVLEDDVEFDADFEIRIQELINQAPKNWSIIYLGCNSQHKAEFFKPCRPANNQKIEGAPLIKLGDQCVAGGWAYVVNSQTALNLVRNTLPIKWPLDYAIKNYFIGEQRYGPFNAYCASPEVARTGGSGSDIGKRGKCKDIACIQ